MGIVKNLFNLFRREFMSILSKKLKDIASAAVHPLQHATEHLLYPTGAVYFVKLRQEIGGQGEPFTNQINKVIWTFMGVSCFSGINTIGHEKDSGVRSYKLSSHIAKYAVHAIEAAGATLLAKHYEVVNPLTYLSVYGALDFANDGQVIDGIQGAITFAICETKLLGQCTYPAHS